MIRLLSMSAATVFTLAVFAAPNAAEARTCKIVGAKAIGLSEKSANNMVERREKRRINRFARMNKSTTVKVKDYGTDCKKGEVLFRCEAKSKACV